MRRSETDGGRLGATLDQNGSSEVVATREAGQLDYAFNRQALREVGFHAAGPDSRPGYQEQYDFCQRLVEGAMAGSKRAAILLQEAMTISDFPSLFGDVLDRSVLANYAETPYTWDMYAKRAILNDTRLARMFRVDRGAAVLDGPIVPDATTGASGSGPTGLEQISSYPMRHREASGYTDQLYKFGCRMAFSLETIIADDLDALKDTPALFGRAARRTEEKRATKLFSGSTGPSATFFNTANKNILNNTTFPGYTAAGFVPNPPFSPDALMNALALMAMQRDKDGEPISIEGAVLVYGPALKVTVKNVLNARTLWLNTQGGQIAQNAGLTAMTSGVRLEVANWASGIAKEALNYYIPVVDTTHGNTSWYLFVEPNQGRPAMQLSFLRGREAPQLFMRLPNQVAIGEGRMGPGAGAMGGTSNTNPSEGDYESDGLDYKVRHFIGGAPLDPICGFASNGTGS